MPKTNDADVISAMGDKFDQFRKLALMVKEQPATRAYAERQMAKLLDAMTPGQRLALRAALRAAGVRK